MRSPCPARARVRTFAPRGVAVGVACLTAVWLSGCGEAAPRERCEASSDPGCLVEPVSVAGLGRHTAAAGWPDGRLAVASWDVAQRAVTVAFYQGSGGLPELRLVSPEMTTRRALGGDIAVAATSNGRVQVVWYDADRRAALWAEGDAAGFGEPEVIGTDSADRGRFVSLALDANDRPHVAYRDDTRRQLVYATRPGEAASWVTTVVDPCAGEPGCGLDEDAGEFAAIALVPGLGGVARPHIAFYDRLRGDLKLAARGEDGTWTTSTLDGRDPTTGTDTGDVGRFLSLAVTPTRTLGLAYFDATRGSLRYLGPGEAPRVIDPGLALRPQGRRRVLVGQYAALRYDSGGGAHIVYVDTTTPALRYVVVRAAVTSAPVELPLPAGAWLSLVRVERDPEKPGTRLIGAYGAFGAGPHETALATFALDTGAAP